MKATLIVKTIPLLLLAGGCTNFYQQRASGGYFLTQTLATANERERRATIVPVRGCNLAIRTGASVAVAELGEPTPAEALVSAVRRTRHFESIVASPGGPAHPLATRSPYGRGPTYVSPFDPASRELARREAEQFTAALDAARVAARVAADQRGCDYAVVFAFSSHGQHTRAYVGILDLLLIFPLFIVPDQKLEATAQGVAWLIDARTGGVLRCETASADDWRLANFTAAGSGVRLSMRSAENRVADRLATRLTDVPTPLRTITVAGP